MLRCLELGGLELGFSGIVQVFFDIKPAQNPKKIQNETSRIPNTRFLDLGVSMPMGVAQKIESL